MLVIRGFISGSALVPCRSSTDLGENLVLTILSKPLWPRVCQRLAAFCGAALLLSLGLFPSAAGAVSSDITEDDTQRARFELTDGSVIFGKFKDFRGGVITIATSFNDNLKVKAKLIENFQSRRQAMLLLNDGNVISVPVLDVVDGMLRRPNADAIALADVSIVNPAAWERGDGYNWKGNASTAIAFNRGNTETDDLDLRVDTTFASTRDRYTVRGSVDKSYAYVDILNDLGETETDKRTTADRWQVAGKYDYFLANPRDYFGINATAEADELADIKLRTIVGPYFGTKLIDRANLRLEGELGLSHVSTDFIEAPDRNYTGLNWNVQGESSVLGGDSRVYLKHVGVINTNKTDELILNTTVGIAFPLMFGLEGGAEVTLDFDGGAAEGKKELDQVYRMRVGYAW